MTEITNVPSGLCTVCKQPSNFKCSKCKFLYYCSVEHQKMDWASHKISCSTIANLNEMTQKTINRNLAIYLKLYLMSEKMIAQEAYDVYSTSEDHVYVILFSECIDGNLMLDINFTGMLSTSESIRESIKDIFNIATEKIEIEHIIELYSLDSTINEHVDSEAALNNIKKYVDELKNQSIIMINIYTAEADPKKYLSIIDITDDVMKLCGN